MRLHSLDLAGGTALTRISNFLSLAVIVFMATVPLCAAASVGVGGSTQAKQAKNAASQQAPEQTGKYAVRNNAASLLADLLNSEKNVGKILLLKPNSGELGQLVKAISKTADDGQAQIVMMAKTDTSLDLHDIGLPPGERAAREASAKTDEVDLILASGRKFQFDLLLTQAQALSYGSHLAKVASENCPSQAQAKQFHSLETSLNDLYKRVVAQMRAEPPEKRAKDTKDAELQK